jgi:hypothetical protein
MSHWSNFLSLDLVHPEDDFASVFRLKKARNLMDHLERAILGVHQIWCFLYLKTEAEQASETQDFIKN